MIGKICSFVTPYYDINQKRNLFKSRPVLIIGVADAGDYNVFPISKVTNKANIDPNYNLPINCLIYPLLGLDYNSYIRLHKQTFVNNTSLGKLFGDMKMNYFDLYLLVLSKLEEYNKNLIDNAL